MGKTFIFEQLVGRSIDFDAAEDRMIVAVAGPAQVDIRVTGEDLVLSTVRGAVKLRRTEVGDLGAHNISFRPYGMPVEPEKPEPAKAEKPKAKAEKDPVPDLFDLFALPKPAAEVPVVEQRPVADPVPAATVPVVSVPVARVVEAPVPPVQVSRPVARPIAAPMVRAERPAMTPAAAPQVPVSSLPPAPSAEVPRAFVRPLAVAPVKQEAPKVAEKPAARVPYEPVVEPPLPQALLQAMAETRILREPPAPAGEYATVVPAVMHSRQLTAQGVTEWWKDVVASNDEPQASLLDWVRDWYQEGDLVALRGTD